MGKIKKLLLHLSRGGSIDSGWRKAGYSSLSLARQALKKLAEEIPVEGDTAGKFLYQQDVSGVERRVEEVVVYTDGASRGNPGPSAVAAVAYLPSGEMLTTSAKKIGKATNNVAEYLAVIQGLKLARALKAARVEVRLDSELVAKQISGEYRMKSPLLRPLLTRIRRLCRYFKSCKFKKIPREDNHEADRIASAVLKDKPPEN